MVLIPKIGMKKGYTSKRPSIIFIKYQNLLTFDRRGLLYNKVIVTLHVDIVEEDVKLIGCGNDENRVKILR